MIEERKERVVRIDSINCKDRYTAVIRDGTVARMERIREAPEAEEIRDYIKFCQEILESIKQTRG